MRNPFDTPKKIVDENHALCNVQGVDGMSPDSETKDLEGKILIKGGFPSCTHEMINWVFSEAKLSPLDPSVASSLLRNIKVWHANNLSKKFALSSYTCHHNAH